ncbi:MAG: hypothetical protein JW755_05600 [Candidatus Aminicenantes bacterium]|nr:hypothetical protein [Candidatus Aminicenantes bacterium]
MPEKKGILFQEEQRFTQLWILIVVFIPVGLAWYAGIQQLILGKPFGSHPAPDPIMWILWIVFGVIFPIFFFSVKLSTEVRHDGLYIRFFPFHHEFRTLPFEAIKQYAVRDYSPLREYGGYGIRYGSSGKAYNVSGKRGVQLELVSGRKILIGSKKADEMIAAIRAAAGK